MTEVTKREKSERIVLTTEQAQVVMSDIIRTRADSIKDEPTRLLLLAAHKHGQYAILRGKSSERDDDDDRVRAIYFFIANDKGDLTHVIYARAPYYLNHALAVPVALVPLDPSHPGFTAKDQVRLPNARVEAYAKVGYLFVRVEDGTCFRSGQGVFLSTKAPSTLPVEGKSEFTKVFPKTEWKW